MQNPETQAPGRFEISCPKRVHFFALALMCGYGLLLSVPLLASALWVSVRPFGLGTFLVPLAGFAITGVFLPFGFGNSYVMSLVRSFAPEAGRGQDTYIVQLTLTPRVHSGLRAVMEDADDFGCLKVTDSALEFQGDSVNFCIPLGQLGQVDRRSIGWRGLYLWQHRVALCLNGQPGFSEIEVVDRSTLTLPGARSASARLYKRLSEAVAGQRGRGPR
jgi:hypothetical protein